MPLFQNTALAHLGIHRQMACHPNSVRTIRPRRIVVTRRNKRLGCNFGRELDLTHLLEETDEHEGGLVVSELFEDEQFDSTEALLYDNTDLLSETNPGTGIERKEYEWVRRQILV